MSGINRQFFVTVQQGHFEKARRIATIFERNALILRAAAGGDALVMTETEVREAVLELEALYLNDPLTDAIPLDEQTFEKRPRAKPKMYSVSETQKPKQIRNARDCEIL